MSSNERSRWTAIIDYHPPENAAVFFRYVAAADSWEWRRADDTLVARDWIRRAANLLPLVPRHALSQLAAEVSWLLKNESAAFILEPTPLPGTTPQTSNQYLSDTDLRQLLHAYEYQASHGNAEHQPPFVDQVLLCLMELLRHRRAPETIAESPEKPLAFNVLDDIRERHMRVSRLLSITPGSFLGPMDSDAAHTDRNYLLGLIPPEWTYNS